MSTQPNNLYTNIENKTTFILGPCVIENMGLLHTVAKTIKQLADNIDAVFIFKASFDKANRTAVTSYRGPGLEKGLEMLAEIKEDIRKFQHEICRKISEAPKKDSLYCLAIQFFDLVRG